MMKLLLVEDEQTILEVERAYLQKAGFTVIGADDGKTAWNLFQKEKVDLVVLDLNLPQMDGLEVCKAIRANSLVPIIMVTARVEEIDELTGLNLGADDYLKKPFSPQILVARVKALLRRYECEEIKLGPLTIDASKMQVKKNKQMVALTTTQFNILFFLAKNKGRVYTREQIMDHGYDTVLPKDIYDRTVDAHIKSIRRALGDDCKSPQYILTVIGKGYKFNEELA